MSDQYEQAVRERNRYDSKSTNWLTVAFIGFITVGVIILSLSLFGGSSSENKLNTEFQKILFEQSNDLLNVNYHLSNRQDKNKQYFSKLNKYANQINHRFEVISEFIDNNTIAVDKKRFTATVTSYRKKLDFILEKRKELTEYHNSLLKMEQTLPKLLAQNTEVNDLLFKSNASINHIYYVTRQLFLIERITSNVKALNSDLKDSNLIVTAADRMGRDMALLLKVYQGLLKGDYKMDVSKVNNLKVRSELNKLTKLTMILSKEVGRVLQQGPEAYKFIDVRNGLQKDSLILQKNYQALFFEKY